MVRIQCGLLQSSGGMTGERREAKDRVWTVGTTDGKSGALLQYIVIKDVETYALSSGPSRGTYQGGKGESRKE